MSDLPVGNQKLGSKANLPQLSMGVPLIRGPHQNGGGPLSLFETKLITKRGTFKEKDTPHGTPNPPICGKWT